MLWYHPPPKATLQWMKSNIFQSKIVWKGNSVISVIVNQMKQSIRGEFCYIKKGWGIKIGRKKAMRQNISSKSSGMYTKWYRRYFICPLRKNVQSDCLLQSIKWISFNLTITSLANYIRVTNNYFSYFFVLNIAGKMLIIHHKWLTDRTV